MFSSEYFEPIYGSPEIEKCVLHYLKGTIHYDLRSIRYGELMLHGFIDSSWTRNASERNSTSSCRFNLCLGVISWFRRKHDLVTLNLTHVEYMSSINVSIESIWIQKFIEKLIREILEPFVA
jgi:hypothetical protein